MDTTTVNFDRYPPHVQWVVTGLQRAGRVLPRDLCLPRGQLPLADWPAVMQYAQFQGVAPLLYHRLKQSGQLPTALPAPAQTELHQLYLHSAVANTRLFARTGTILQKLSAENIPVIPLKGLYLSEKVYGNIALRPMSDIDLMVPRQQVAHAVAALQGLGFQAVLPLDLPADLARLHSLPFSGPDNFMIDLHWQLVPPESGLALDTAWVWQNARQSVVAGAAVQGPSPEALLLHLGVHFTLMHGVVSRLFHICDLDQVLTAFQEQLDWPLVVEQARRNGLARTTFLALTAAQAVFGSPLDPSALKALLPADYEPRYLEGLLDQVFRGVEFSTYLAEFWAPNPPVKRLRLFFERVFEPPYKLRQRYPRLARGVGLPLAYLWRLGDVAVRQLPVAWKLLRKDPLAQHSARQIQQIVDLAHWLKDEGISR